MGSISVVDLRHYLTPAGALVELPRHARTLAEYFVSIVVDATTNLEGPPTVRCRRSPRHKRCTGIVISYPDHDLDGGIAWFCPECDDAGVILGWQNTLWDGFAELTQTS